MVFDSVNRALEQINHIILGKEKETKLALCCLLARGHLLIEDLPGMGKTTLSHALASTLGLSYSRIQFTSDLLPADITGISIFNQQAHDFTFHAGPIFNQVVLADEINRASPKTQSALLEAMEEKQVSVDGNTHKLPSPFFVIATQNPLHQSGTFPLPESQLDRFLMRITLGFPPVEAERKMLTQQYEQEKSKVIEIINHDLLVEIQQAVDKVTAKEQVIEYILRLVTLTRVSEDFPIPLSPRATMALLKASKAWAIIDGRDFVTHEDVQTVLPSVVEHRLRPETRYRDVNQYSTQLIESVNVLQ
ncbi:MAG: AAA family ATPase [Algicola sp.]|nr:AAA family ATPase [Algicola sp.]